MLKSLFCDFPKKTIIDKIPVNVTIFQLEINVQINLERFSIYKMARTLRQTFLFKEVYLY